MAGYEVNCEISLVPSDETMELIIKLLNAWQDTHPNQRIVMIPKTTGDEYKIVEIEVPRKRKSADQPKSG